MPVAPVEHLALASTSHAAPGLFTVAGVESVHDVHAPDHAPDIHIESLASVSLTANEVDGISGIPRVASTWIVLLSNGEAVAGWNEASQEPEWWSRPEAPASVAPVSVAEGQQELFPVPKEEAAPPAPPETPAPEWIEKLLTCDEMAAQRAQAARTHIPDERIRQALAALDARGGKLTRPALARQLGVPLIRIGGMISALRRVLNIEGYAVLSVDEDTVVLDRQLLEAQFGLKP